MNNTRHSIDLHLPFFRLSIYKKGPFDVGASILNNLPFEIKALTSNVKHFKRALKSILYFHSFYSIQEYFDLNNHKLLLHGSSLCLFGVYSRFYSNLNMFLSLYVVSYMAMNSYLFYVSIFIILLFCN